MHWTSTRRGFVSPSAKKIRNAHSGKRKSAALAAISAAAFAGFHLLGGRIASAATDTWSGSADTTGNWTLPANWGGTTIQAGDSLIFSATTGSAQPNDN